MDKKGISPLTSTILLLVLSILIGVVVMNWGRAYIEQSTATNEVVSPQQPALFDDLNTRLNNGEITKEQYDKIKAVLMTQNSK